MKLEVATFVDPAGDPKLARLAAYLRAIDLRPVDYHRVTADNTEGALPDRERPVRFALDLAALQTGKSVEARFVCDAVSFEWPPPPAAGKDATDSYRELRESLCANGPAQPRAIQPGEKEVYYLFTERGFAERGIRDMRVFGPLDVELK